MALTKEQASFLGDRLIDTTGSIYSLAHDAGFGDITDDDIDLVCETGGIFRCEECNRWQDDSMKASGFTACCDDCAGTDDDCAGTDDD
jgi:hypothetical protein